MPQPTISRTALVLAAGVLLVLPLACGRHARVTGPPPPSSAGGSVVAGEVLYDDGRPAFGAPVILEPLVNGRPLRAERAIEEALAPGAGHRARDERAAGGDDSVRTATTDSRGRFAFSEVAPGDYALSTHARAHFAADARAHVEPLPAGAAPETVFVSLELVPVGTFAGTATLEGASDHRGTLVYIGASSNLGLTNAAGRYVLHDVPLGSWTLIATHAGYLDRSAAGTLSAAGDSAELAPMLLPRDRNIAPIAQASFICSGSCINTLPVRLTAAGSRDPDGTIVRYEWDFEDDGSVDYSSTSSGDVSHLYSLGSHRAKLTVTDDDGAIGLDVTTFTVAVNVPPHAVASYTCPAAGCNSATPVQFSAAGSADSDGTIVLYAWDFDGDGVNDFTSSTTGNTSHLYGGGSQRARLIVTDNRNGADTAFVSFAVATNLPPQAVASYSCAGPCIFSNPVQLLADGSSDPDGTIALYAWDFENDGVNDYSSPSFGNVSHLYAGGTHSARLTVTDNAGAADTAVVSFFVSPGPSFVFVSISTGSITGDGSQSRPFRDIAAGIQAAAGSPEKRVLVAAGTYPETIVLKSVLTLEGGYDPATWTRASGSYSVVEGGSSAALAQGVTSTSVSGMEFRSAAGTMASPSSIALRVISSGSSLAFVDCRFVARAGRSGAVGADGILGLPGGPGGKGGDGCSECSGGGAGGNPGAAPLGGSYAGGRGGSGGYGADGAAGDPGAGTPASAGGPGGALSVECGVRAANGIPGQPGSPGAAGSSGTPATNGGVVGNVWMLSSGGPGGRGGNGTGGGAGGGGGSGPGVAGSCNADRGGGGGGGGGGGAGGYGAEGGGGGGASIALLLIDSSPTITSCAFISASGGDAGSGGNGSAGGKGGAGGAGGLGVHFGGSGGVGAAGGRGGASGGGAGGGGGPSWCIWRAGSSSPAVSLCTFTFGVGGRGGTGGLSGAGVPAADGPDGPAGDIGP